MSENLKTSYKTDSQLAQEYLIRQALASGIATEHIAINQQQIQRLIDEPWMCQNRGNWVNWLKDIFDVHSTWAQTRQVILIEGATIAEREMVAQTFLYRSIVNNAAIGLANASVRRAEELIRVFSQFGDDRTELLELLRRIQCLLITEIEKQYTPQRASLGNLYFNELLQTRLDANRPTILTFANLNIQERSYGEFSRLLDEIIQRPEQGLRKVYHFRLETKV